VLTAVGAVALGLAARSLRLSRAAHGEPALWVLGSAPSFCWALGGAAAILAVAQWIRPGPRSGWAAALSYLATALIYELRQRGDARQTFDWVDVAALLAGAAVALLIDQWVARAESAPPGAGVAAA
jgi:hypothetical protein